MAISEELTKEVESAVEQRIEELNQDVKTDKLDEVDNEVDEKENELKEEEGDSSDSKVESELKDDNEPNDDTSDKESDDSSVKEDKNLISDDVIGYAVASGISVEDALSFPNEESLVRVIKAVENVKQRTTTREVKKEERDEEDIFADFPKLDPENFDPEIIKYFDTLKSTLKTALSKQQKQISENQTKYEQFQQGIRRNAEIEVENWFDKQIEEMGSNYEDILGKGRYRSLKPGSKSYKNRETIANTMAALMGSYRTMGSTIPPREDVFDLAVAMSLGDQISNKEKFDVEKKEDSNDRIARKLAGRSVHHVQRASGRKGKVTKSPQQEAAEAISEKYGVPL